MVMIIMIVWEYYIAWVPLSSRRSSYQTTFFCLPLLEFPLHPFNYICLRAGLSKGIDEFSVRIHEIEKYGMVNEVVIIRFGTWWRREIYAVRLARRLGRRIIACQSDEARVEVAHITSHLRERVACGVDRNEYWLNDGTIRLVYTMC